MSTGAYLAGAGFFVPTVGAAVGAATIVLRRRCGYLSGPPRWLALAALATAALVFVNLLPAALGVLTRGTVLAAAALTVLCVWLLVPSTTGLDREAAARPPRSGPVSIVIAAATLVAVMSYELARLHHLIDAPVTDIDLLGFHLPGVARFIQTGTVWGVDQFLPGFATSQYPHNGDFLILATVLPWHEMAFARMTAVVFYFLTGVAVYALAVELGARRATAVTFTALALVVRPLALFALEGLPDDSAVALLAIGCLFMARYRRRGRGGELALAGLSLGLALGAEWFGLTAAAVIVVAWLGQRALAHDRIGAIMRDLASLLAAIVLGGGFWLVRNLVESGNPLYPKTISLFGATLFQGSRGDVIDRYGYTLAHYLPHPHILREFIYPGFRDQLGWAGAVLLLALVLAAIAAGRLVRRKQTGSAPILWGAAIVIGLLIVYTITPGTAYGFRNLPTEAFVTIRWLTPAIAIGAAVGAAGLARLGRPALLIELAAAAAAFDAIRLGPPVPTGTVTVIAVAGAALAVLWLASAAGLRARLRRAAPAKKLALAAAALVAVVVLGRVDQRRVDRHGYASYDPVFAWIDRYAPSGHVVGITGSTGATPGLAPVLPAFGPRLGNTVGYVGRRVVHSVELPSRMSQMATELRRGRYDLLLIGLPYAGPTDAWARRLGLQQLARSDRLAVYRVPRQR